ncbi:hypothetical protein [Pantoea ananatis]|uniref:hypothetical protein n=1 Tax=Pantoea ananas TaxID=553 RepID=UPI0021F7395D|nr:hypothetical protein [Pantoea ananatis]MCW0351047.1 hypothetical protein [Pantoea ananatis]
MYTDSADQKKYKTERHDWCDPLVRACRDFVKFKDDMDMANRTSCLNPAFIRKMRWLTGLYEPSCKRKNNNWGSSATASNPVDFAHFALPFLCTISTEIRDCEKCLIYPQLVVSGTYNSYNHGLEGGYASNSPEEVMDWSDKCVLDNEIASDPRYFRPEGLPLYVAIEGKNRVELFKRHRSMMLAWVVPKTTVPFERLKIIRLKPFNVWAVSHGSKVCVLPFSRHTLPIYRALDVGEGKPRWDLYALKKLRDARINAFSSQMCR